MEVNFEAKPISNNQATRLSNQLRKCVSADIICHNSSDEDALACAKALQWFLDKQKIVSRIISDNATDTFEINDKNFKIIDTISQKLPQKIDNAICVDFSSLSRMGLELANLIKKSKNLICIDHHINSDINDLTNDIYIDTTAKSCSGILLRMFEGLKLSLPSKIKKILYCGMCDDFRKNNYIRFDESLRPIQTNLLKNDLNSYYLYQKLINDLSQNDKDEVISHLNVLSRLSPMQKNFKDSLEARMKTVANGKFGFIEIPENNLEWKALGGDNKFTSSIMSHFRVNILENPIYPNLDSIAIFYPVNNAYRLSIHSKSDNVLNLFNQIRKQKIPNLIAGGHANRGGGCINSTEPEVCHDWVVKIVDSARNFYKKNLLDGS